MHRNRHHEAARSENRQGRNGGHHRNGERRGAGRRGTGPDWGPEGDDIGMGGGRHGRGMGRGMGGMGPGTGGRGGGRRRVFNGEELRLVLLKLVSEEPRHGYDLIRAIEALTGGAYAPSPGVVYPTLTMLHDMNLITEAESEGARKAYAVTVDGTAHLDGNAEVVKSLFARLAAFAAMRERTDGGPIRRAMDNLRTVLINRFKNAEGSTETLNQAVEILDDAARRIERL